MRAQHGCCAGVFHYVFTDVVCTENTMLVVEEEQRSLGLMGLMKGVHVAVVWPRGLTFGFDGDRRLGSARLLARAGFGVGRS